MVFDFTNICSPGNINRYTRECQHMIIDFLAVAEITQNNFNYLCR